MMDKLLKDVNRISYDFLVKEPFYGHFFVGFVKKKTDRDYQISFQPSSEFVQFEIEEAFWFEQTDKVKKGLLKHELLHLVFKHPLRMKDFILKNIAYLAADLVVNQQLHSDELPEDAFTLSYLRSMDMELEKDKNLRYYYRELEMIYYQLKQIRTQVQSNCENEENGGSCYSAQLQDQIGKNPDDESLKQGLKQEKLLALMDKRTGMPSHQTWRSFEEEPESKNGLLEHNINAHLENIANKMTLNNSWGSVGSFLKSYISRITLYEPQKVDWKRAMKLFIASSQKTFLKTTMARPSKRYGTTPGIKIKRYCKVCVAIDTSGSLFNEVLSQYFNEIYYIWKQNTEIMIVECDTDIKRFYHYKGVMPDFVLGRGGTDFNAPIQYNNEVFKGDALIYLTDGYAPVPTVKSKVPIFWLIFGNKEETKLPGRVVYMD